MSGMPHGQRSVGCSAALSSARCGLVYRSRAPWQVSGTSVYQNFTRAEENTDTQYWANESPASRRGSGDQHLRVEDEHIDLVIARDGITTEAPRRHARMTSYLLDNAWQEQQRRLSGLEAWFDPGTIRHLEALGVGPGWRCLEVGAGGGSIAAWLCECVGPEGGVLATDIDTRFLDAHVRTHPNLTIQRHDLLGDPLPADTFDLAHARFVLEHLPDRRTALARLVSSLRPGGWLLVESTDSSSWLPDPAADPADAALFSRWTTAFQALCLRLGSDANAGRWLFGELRAAGLERIGAEGRVFMVRGGSPQAEVWRLTAMQVRERLIDEGLLSADDLTRLLALIQDPGFVWMEGLVMAGWGQRTAQQRETQPAAE